MSAIEELEEGEITDSDSMEEEKKPSKTEKSSAQQYSMFDNQPRPTFTQRNIPRPPRSESDNSDDDDDDGDSDEDSAKKKKCHKTKTDFNHSETFVNPNFVNNGNKMPPVPQQSKRCIWGSILQEQILTAEVGSFSMEKKLPSDRDIESYDYTRAKDDDRPHPVEDEMKNVEEDLFGEVIDFDKAAQNQRRGLKRKHVKERLGTQSHVKKRLHLPRATENSSPEDVTYFISNELQEAKVHLIRRVVKVLGRAKALDLLRETEKVEAAGGMMIMNGSRRRTPGGVYLMLLKNDKGVSQQELDEIFEEENKLTLELRKQRKARSRRRRKDREAVRKVAEDTGSKTCSMEVVEASGGQASNPQSHTKHPSDTGKSQDGSEKDSAKSDSDSEGEYESEVEDLETGVPSEGKHQAEAKETEELSAGGDADGITLDDVLDLDVDDDFID